MLLWQNQVMTGGRLLGALFALALIVSACGEEENPVFAQAQAEIDVLLETEEGREQLVATLANGSPMTLEESECFIDNSTSRDLAGIIVLGSGQSGTDISGVLDPIREAMNACGIRLDAFNLQ